MYGAGLGRKPRAPAGAGGIQFLLRSVGIRTRLVVAFLLVSILPIVIIAASTASRFARAMDNQVESYSGQVVAELAKNVSGNLDRLLALSESVIIDKSVQAALRGSDAMPVRDRREMLLHLDEELSSQIYRYNKVRGITLFRKDGALLFETGYELFRAADLERLRTAPIGSDQNMYWTTIANLRGLRTIVLARMVNSVDAVNESIGSLLIMVDEGLFARETFRGVDMGKESELFIATADGTVISAAGSRTTLGSRVGDGELLAALRKAAEGGGGSADYRGPAGRSLVCASAVDVADWIVAARIPYEAIAAVSGQVLRNVVLACLLVLAAVTFLASAIFASISGPLARLSLAAAALRAGDFSSRLGDPFRDEVGDVARAMDEAAVRLAALVEEIRVGQEGKRRAEIEMLKSQISPHFLFNTLDSIKWTAMLRGDGFVAEGIGALTSLLRNGALATEETATLDLELGNLGSYALIMKLRYGEGFRLEFEADEEALSCRLPRLLLQPIVENSIVHGTGDSSLSLVTVRVRASISSGSLFVLIEDDGKGFDGAASGGEEDERFSGIGLRNVSERLRLHYGRAGSLRVESRPGEGTRVTIRLPAERGDPKADPCIG